MGKSRSLRKKERNQMNVWHRYDMKFNVKDLNRLRTVLKIHLVFSVNFDFFFLHIHVLQFCIYWKYTTYLILKGYMIYLDRLRTGLKIHLVFSVNFFFSYVYKHCWYWKYTRYIRSKGYIIDNTNFLISKLIRLVLHAVDDNERNSGWIS